MDTAAVALQFHEDGFAVARDVFSRDEVDALDRELVTFIRDVAPTLEPGDIYYEDTPDRPIKSMFRMEQHAKAFASVLTDDRLVNLVRTIYDDPDAFLCSTMFFAKAARSGSVTPAHQDNAFQCWDPPEAIVITIAIDASTCDNGVLVCQKGSHRLGILPHSRRA
jgi:ectoine hydroxylase-related dioxygenase (phytanoyl-CoA dioxygenase family)